MGDQVAQFLFAVIPALMVGVVVFWVRHVYATIRRMLDPWHLGKWLAKVEYEKQRELSYLYPKGKYEKMLDDE